MLRVNHETSVKVMQTINLPGEYVISMVDLGSNMIACSTEDSIVLMRDGLELTAMEQGRWGTLSKIKGVDE